MVDKWSKHVVKYLSTIYISEKVVWFIHKGELCFT